MSPLHKVFFSALIAAGLLLTVSTALWVSSCVPNLKYPKPAPPDTPE